MKTKRVAKHWTIVYREPTDRPSDTLRLMPSTRNHRLARRLADILMGRGCWNVRVERV